MRSRPPRVTLHNIAAALTYRQMMRVTIFQWHRASADANSAFI